MPSEEEFCKFAKQELSYDAWGRLRNPATQTVYAQGSEPALFLGRGYTGNEHLPWFGLINMNFAVKREQYQTCLDIAEREQKARSERPALRPAVWQVSKPRPVCANAGFYAKL